MKKILSIILLILITSTSWSQNYPVQSNVIITPPYSVYLSDYASISSEKMIVNLMLKDINQSDLPIKLRIRIKGQGIELITSESYQPLPILLQGGVPVQISGTELESYLNPANLEFSGISHQQFIKTGKLPEGIYQFCVEAIEYRRNVLISNTGCTLAWLVLNDPPRFLLPENNTTLTATNPQNLFFTWMPMNTGSPNSVFTTEYEFTMVEIWPDNRNPNDAINSIMPLYQTITSNTALTYGPAEPALVPGRKYVCRLRAYDTEGRDLFKNNGYSEILTFTFGQECLPPININHNIENHEQVKTNWQSLPGQTRYRLSYNEQNPDDTWSGWYHNETILPYSTITNLKAEHTYRYKLIATCSTIESEYSEVKEFTTPEKDENEIECGKDFSIPPVDDSPPLEYLQPGDKIYVGGFEATVIESEGANGTFTGECVVNVKNFGVRVLSEFRNISINQSMQVTAGEINAIKGELKLLDVDALFDSLGVGTGDDIFDDENQATDSLEFSPPESIIVILDGEDFIITGDTTIITARGDTIITDFGLIPPIIIVNGDTTIINNDEIDLDNPDGGNDDIAEEQNDTPPYTLKYLEFNEYQDPTGVKMGFDAYPDIPQYLSEYKKKEVHGNEYIVPWQSVEANGIQAKVNMLIGTELPDSINTRLKVEMNGTPLNFTSSSDNDTIRLLNVSGKQHKEKELITAYYINDEEEEIPIGYLNLISYERQNFNLEIVPVDGEFNHKSNELKDYLNKVYAPAITSWKVKIIEPLVVNYNEAEENGLNTSRSFLSSFNKEMKSIIEAMKDRGDYDKENYYLFVMDKAENESLNGLMPFNSHFGFIFTGDNPVEAKLFRTIAHELGHGAFKLKHNFDDKGTTKRTTQNLMDYLPTTNSQQPIANYTVLRKFQWKEIIDPRLIAFGWSEEFYSEGMKRGFKVIIDNSSAENEDEKTRIIFDNNELTLMKSDFSFKLTYKNKDFEEIEGKWKVLEAKDNEIMLESSGINLDLVLNEYDSDKIIIKVKNQLSINNMIFKINIISIEYEKNIESKFNEIKSETGKKLSELRENFKGELEKVNLYIENKEYDPFMIKGINNEYISEGMSNLFEENTTNTDELDNLSKILLNMIEKDKEIIQLIEKQKVYYDIESDKNKNDDKSDETEKESNKWNTFINFVQEQLISKHKRKLEFNQKECEEDFVKNIIQYVDEYKLDKN